MSSQLPFNQEESKTRESTHNEARMKEIAQPGELAAPTGKEQLEALVRGLRSPEDGHSIDHIGKDGVYRVLQYLPTPPDQPSQMAIYDAKPMSPEMIKAYLDTQPWRQEVEDRFRGVDGRTLSEEQLWNPPPEMLPEFPNKNERDENKRKWREEKKEKEEKIARGEVEA